MTDREILAAIRRHCAEAEAERNRYPATLQDLAQVTFLYSFYAGCLKSIREELTHIKCDRCESRPADGSGIMCTECWVDTGDGS